MESVLAFFVLGVFVLTAMQIQLILKRSEYQIKTERKQLKQIEADVGLALTEPVEKLRTDSRFVVTAADHGQEWVRVKNAPDFVPLIKR
ncbi:hypothetical protein [Candidatus Magnetaquicoccus inordinatus]|uniref:hypothetical protein n=1 Tax=Candidatus Magnetaquicoccus inordinatus TaxID=2496818 RepID=UPI00102CC7ED|nr:hypothetical protein [Candidatus Magnetaquicoccus inordinatus]